MVDLIMYHLKRLEFPGLHNVARLESWESTKGENNGVQYHFGMGGGSTDRGRDPLSRRGQARRKVGVSSRISKTRRVSTRRVLTLYFKTVYKPTLLETSHCQQVNL